MRGVAMRRARVLGSLLFLAAAGAMSAGVKAAAPEPQDTLNRYLVNITAGQVTAASLLGLDKSAVTTVQTSQDLVAAINPFSDDEQKSGFGIAITPARTTLLPMSGNTYAGGWPARLAGSLTFSYAQNRASIGGVDFKRQAASVDTLLYLRKEEDPIMIGSAAFAACARAGRAANAAEIDRIALDPNLRQEERDLLLEAQTRKLSEALGPCIDAALGKAKWNSSRVALSYGQGRIKPAAGRELDDGKYLTVNALFQAGERGAWNLSLRRSTDVLETANLDPAAPRYASASLAALRYTYGDLAGTDFRALAEVSNANAGTANAAKDVFIYALGLDKNLAKGIWLSFRLGRNHTLDGARQETTGLLNLSLQPSLTSFLK